MYRQINFAFLAILILGTLLFAGGTHLLHGLQAGRTAGALLEQADKAKDKGELSLACAHMERYLRLVRNHVPTMVKLGDALEELSRKKGFDKRKLQAYIVYEKVLMLEPKRKDVREKCVALAMLGRFDAAQEHLRILLESSPQDAEIEHKLGICAEKRKDLIGAREWYTRARDHAPGELKHYLALAQTYRDENRGTEKTRDALKDMVARNPKNAQAHLKRGEVLLGLAAANGQDKQILREAGEAIDEARSLVPTEENLFPLLARLAMVRGKMDEARQHFLDGIEAHPKSVLMYFSLVQLEVKEKNLDKALEVVERGLKSLPEEKDLKFADAELLLEKGDIKKAESALVALRAAAYPEVLTEYLQGRLYIQKEQWSQAEQLLSKLRLKLTSESRVLLGGVEFLLGQCYDRLGNPDQALFVYQEAVKSDLASMAARFKVAQTYVTLDRLEDAIREYQQILAFAKPPAVADLALARVLIQQNPRLPKAARQQSWDTVRRHLTRAAENMADSVDVPLLQAEALLLQAADEDNADKKAQARRLVEKARDARPERVEFWLGLAYLTGRDDVRQGLAVLAEAEQHPKVKGRVELTLTKMQFVARGPSAEARKRLAAMEQEIAAAPEADRNRLRFGLARAFYQAQGIEDATRLWKQVADAEPQNMNLRLILLDLALVQNKGEETEPLIEQTRALEGENGTFWRYATAYRLYQESKPKDKQELDHAARARLTEARALLTKVGKSRPSWYAATALEGQIDDLEGRREKATDNLLRAVNLGDRRAGIVRRLVELLWERKRYLEAENAIRKLIDQENTLLAAGLGRIAVQALLHSEEVAHALRLALKSVPENSTNYKDHLWLGQIYGAVRKRAEARRELAEACKQGPAVAETWETYVYFLASLDQRKEAEAVLEQAKEKLPANLVPLTLAHCYTVLGKFAEAEKQYEAAKANPPKDANIPRDLADFYLKTEQLAKAEPLLRDFLKNNGIANEQKAWAGRNLAIVVGTQPGYVQFNKGLELLKENEKIDGASVADQRARAALFSTHPGHRRDAIFQLEDLDRIQPLSAEERFLLVKLYTAADNRPRVRRHFITLLLSPDGKKPLYYATYVRLLLQMGEIIEAKSWLKDLEALAPDSPLTFELQVRLLRSRGKHKEATALIQEFARRREENFQPALNLADDLASADKDDPCRKLADDLHQERVRQADGDKGFLGYARFLGRQQRLGEAMDWCAKALVKGNAETVLTAAVGILRGNRDAPRDQLATVEGWLKKRLQDGPGEQVELWNILADLYDLQGRYPEAIALYRKVLDRRPENLLAINNLAWLLALRDKNPEALQLSQRLLDLAGPVPEFHDTRGVIFLCFDKKNEALAELNKAADFNPSAATLFHKAQAQLQLQDSSSAKATYNTAKAKGLSTSRVHPLEWEEMRRLDTALKQ